jgi:hypothetical protein
MSYYLAQEYFSRLRQQFVEVAGFRVVVGTVGVAGKTVFTHVYCTCAGVTLHIQMRIILIGSSLYHDVHLNVVGLLVTLHTVVPAPGNDGWLKDAAVSSRVDAFSCHHEQTGSFSAPNCAQLDLLVALVKGGGTHAGLLVEHSCYGL